jgi:hypothetical protein
LVPKAGRFKGNRRIKERVRSWGWLFRGAGWLDGSRVRWPKTPIVPWNWSLWADWPEGLVKAEVLVAIVPVGSLLLKFVFSVVVWDSVGDAQGFGHGCQAVGGCESGVVEVELRGSCLGICAQLVGHGLSIGGAWR